MHSLEGFKGKPGLRPVGICPSEPSCGLNLRGKANDSTTPARWAWGKAEMNCCGTEISVGENPSLMTLKLVFLP